MININEFPDIILLKIFSFLKYGELSRSKGVCKQWSDLIQSQTLLRVVDASDVVMDYHRMVQLVPLLGKSVTCLRILGTLQKMLLTPTLLQKLEERCPKLTTLILEEAFVSKDSGMSNITLFDFPSQLQTLSLRKSFFQLEQLIQNQTEKPKIKCLDLSDCWCFNDLHHFYLTQLPYLQELYLSHCDTLMNVEQLIPMLPQLKVLDIEGNQCSSNVIKVISTSCPQMVKLYIGRLQIYDEDLKHFTFPALRELCVWGTGLSDSAFKVILLSRMPLVWLNCSFNGISCNVIEIARRAYPYCTFVNSSLGSKEKYFCQHFIKNVYSGKML